MPNIGYKEQDDMQVFIVDGSLETAIALDAKRLNKQIIECQQILDALNGKKAWSNHPCVLQYKGYEKWLVAYQSCLENYHYYKNGKVEFIGSVSKNHLSLMSAIKWSELADLCIPPFHTQEYYDQMKRRLYTKDPNHYKLWAHLGTSECNWYWSPTENKFIKYINGKRIE